MNFYENYNAPPYFVSIFFSFFSLSISLMIKHLAIVNDLIQQYFKINLTYSFTLPLNHRWPLFNIAASEKNVVSNSVNSIESN